MDNTILPADSMVDVRESDLLDAVIPVLHLIYVAVRGTCPDADEFVDFFRVSKNNKTALLDHWTLWKFTAQGA